eukprot:522877-Rhodomonas_salina.2
MLQTLGFFVMVLMLIRVINTTAVHPRIGVLIGTVNDDAALARSLARSVAVASVTQQEQHISTHH